MVTATHDMAAPAKLTVFYDGSCPLCTREIGFYRRRQGADALAWVDVSKAAGADVIPGLSCAAAMARFHVRRPDGALVSGGRAFAELWAALPAFAWLGRLFRWGPLSALLDLAYRAFLPLRPRLQRLARRKG